MSDRKADSVRDRWRYCVRLLRLLGALSPRGMAINALVTLWIGLAPLLSLAALRHLVDAAARAGSFARSGAAGAGLTEALVWAAALAGATFLQEAAWIVGVRVRDE